MLTHPSKCVQQLVRQQHQDGQNNCAHAEQPRTQHRALEPPGGEGRGGAGGRRGECRTADRDDADMPRKESTGGKGD